MLMESWNLMRSEWKIGQDGWGSEDLAWGEQDLKNWCGDEEIGGDWKPFLKQQVLILNKR